ncbi:hypothetical protein J6590_012913 [Homalodisca vitripennis]|nr:hypothetical protein J6590_012913 [Homalodisca vitripennis]
MRNPENDRDAWRLCKSMMIQILARDLSRRFVKSQEEENVARTRVPGSAMITVEEL